jgi:hypothetical protein
LGKAPLYTPSLRVLRRVVSVTLKALLVDACGSVFWGSYEIHQPHKIEETFQALTEMYAKGHLKPVTCAVYPLVRTVCCC